MLNVGPKPDGTIPEGAKEVLLAIGAWLDINGEAIYETTPWMVAGEGPTNLGEANETGFNESGIIYTAKDIRFTVKGDNLYAIFLDWPGEFAVINSIQGIDPEPEGLGKEPAKDIPSLVGKTISEEEGPAYPGFYKEEIKRVSLLGDGKDLKWSLTRRGLIVEMPDEKPCDHAFVIKIERYHHPKLK